MAKSQNDIGPQAPAVGQRHIYCPYRVRSGFTIIELLVVIGVVGVLMALLIPALVSSRERALAITCINNKHQLTIAWSMYSGDNNELLANNLVTDSSQIGWAAKSSPNWVNNVMDWELSPDNTNKAFVYTSQLGLYLNYSPSMFRCPSDSVLSQVQKNAGWTGLSGRVRSVSMNAMVGNPGNALQWGANTNNPDYTQFLTESDIPAPSSIIVFLDEHPDSISDGYFLVTDNGQWKRLPGSYHSGGGSFSFADGHAAIHHWQDATTLRPPVPDGANLPIILRPNQMTDYNWVLEHSSVERN